MTKFLLSLIGYFVAMGISILVMIFGWGLSPESWGWIVGGYLAASVLGAIFQLAK